MAIAEKPETRQRENFARRFLKWLRVGRARNDYGMLLAARIPVADVIPVDANVLGLYLHYRKVKKGNDKFVDGRIFELDAIGGCSRRRSFHLNLPLPAEISAKKPPRHIIP
jgi:hypothetical protein